MTGKYDDIIGLPHPVSAVHPQMMRADRAAQFSPFAALTGYGDAVKETARRTDEKPELTDEEKEKLNRKLQFLAGHPGEKPTVSIFYFKEDERKSGGACVTVSGAVKKIDTDKKTVVMQDGTEVGIDQMIAITNSDGTEGCNE